jgi:hypothetical protein
VFKPKVDDPIADLRRAVAGFRPGQERLAPADAGDARGNASANAHNATHTAAFSRSAGRAVIPRCSGLNFCVAKNFRRAA